LSIAYLLVLLALAALGGAIWALFWAIDSGQYDDVEQYGTAPLEPDDGDAPDPLEKSGGVPATDHSSASRR
jgi:cbb3-type cytochrome oxidase maturation protein